VDITQEFVLPINSACILVLACIENYKFCITRKYSRGKMSLTMHGFTKTTSQIYRDCLRLIKHIAGKSKKSTMLTQIVRGEFKKNAKLTDEAAIEKLKSNAVRGLANYLMMESSSKDARFQNKSTSYIKREADSLRNIKLDEQPGIPPP
jgi:hypothetical protein